MPEPRVSIVVAYYDVPDLVPIAVESALAQSYSNVEVIVVDDCSTVTPATDALASLASHEKLRIVRHAQNLGLGGARNTGVRSSTGQFIVPLDADDYLDKSYVERALSGCGPDSAGVSTAVKIFGDVELEWRPQPELLQVMCALSSPSTFLYRRQLFEALDGYLPCQDPALPPPADSPSSRLTEPQRQCLRAHPDVEFWLRLLERGYKINYLDEPLYFYRKAGSGLSTVGSCDEVPMLAALHPKLYGEHMVEILRLQEEKYWQAKNEFNSLEQGYNQMHKYYTELQRDYDSLASVHHEVTCSRSWSVATKLMQSSALLKRIIATSQAH